MQLGSATSARPRHADNPLTPRQRAEAMLAERKRRQDDLLDEALEETFPASDPVSVMCIA